MLLAKPLNPAGFMESGLVVAVMQSSKSLVPLWNLEMWFRIVWILEMGKPGVLPYDGLRM